MIEDYNIPINDEDAILIVRSNGSFQAYIDTTRYEDDNEVPDNMIFMAGLALCMRSTSFVDSIMQVALDTCKAELSPEIYGRISMQEGNA